MKTYRLTRIILGLSWALLAIAPTTWAQDHPMDLRELSLKELLSLDVVEITAGDANTFYRGAWTVGYRYIFQQMKGYMVGRNSVSPESLLRNNGGPYAIVQDEMTQEMHIIEGTYSATDRLSILLGIPFILQTTSHQRVPGPNPNVGEEFDVTTDGLSDISLKLAYTVFQGDMHQLIGFAGVSLPTGSIDEEGTTPRGKNSPLPYTMQLGSGTYDLDPGIAYSGRAGKWSWGAEFLYKVRLDENDADYNFGDRYTGSLYLTHRVSDWFAPSILLTGRGWEEISGRDPRLDPVRLAVPVANPALYGGERLDLLFRLNFAAPRGFFKGHRLALEGGFPVYQDLNGPQMRADFRLGASWQWTF
jgi:hypothetical protein